MDLLSIRSADETEEIKSLKLSKEVWTGGNCLQDRKNWNWSSKLQNENKFAYTNWMPGEPNNSGGVESCARIYLNLKWNDIPCNLKELFVCEKLVEQIVDAPKEINQINIETQPKPNDNTSHSEVQLTPIKTSTKETETKTVNCELTDLIKLGKKTFYISKEVV